MGGWSQRVGGLASCGPSSRVLRERLPSRLGDLHPCGLDPASATADNHALAVRSREPSAHKVEYLPDRKAMRPQHRLGAAVARRGQQFERAYAVGLRAAMA